MVKKIGVLGVLLMIVVVLAACGTSDGESASAGDGSATIAPAEPGTTGTVVRLNDDGTDALPVSSQLSIGTLMLEGTEDAVSVEQAGALLPNWQMLEALQSSGTAAEAELDAILNQIQGAMTDAQLTAIKEMQLTSDSMMELMQEQGLRMGAGAGAGGGGGRQPPAGVDMGGAGGPGGQFGALGGDQDLSAKEQEAAMAERMNASMTAMVVSMLKARAEGESWEIAATDQETVLRGEVLAVVAEATGLDQLELMSQSREGKTLGELAVANGADVDEIVAKVVMADTERVNQAVADGSLEQANAGQWLAGLEALAKEMLE